MSRLTAAPADDRGLLLGDGLFETVLAIDERLIFLAEHLARLERGCLVLGLPAPDRTLIADAAKAALADAGLGSGRAAVRVTWTAGSGGRGLDRPATLEPRLIVTASPASSPLGPARLIVSSIQRNPASPTSRLKTLAYLDNVLARREARAAGANEAVMTNTRGELACAAAANLFWVEDDVLFTPTLDCGVLDGIARAKVLEFAAALGARGVEAHVGPDVLATAQAIFLTNSLVGVRPAMMLGGAEPASHPLIAALVKVWDADLAP